MGLFIYIDPAHNLDATGKGDELCWHLPVEAGKTMLESSADSFAFRSHLL